MLTHKRLLEILRYEPSTGKFIWLIGKRGHASGVVAGSMNHNGYRRIGIDGVVYQAHRLAWLHVNGCWPNGLMDHINGIKDDNRIANLREATGSQNAANRRIANTNTSGLKGVCWNKKLGCWQAQITINRKQKHLGLFDTKEAAHSIYMKAAEKHFKEFARIY